MNVSNIHALRRLSRKADPKRVWGMLSEPVDPLDNFKLARAQSLMTPTPRGGACPALTLAQAEDVIRWAGAA